VVSCPFTIWHDIKISNPKWDEKSVREGARQNNQVRPKREIFFAVWSERERLLDISSPGGKRKGKLRGPGRTEGRGKTVPPQKT